MCHKFTSLIHNSIVVCELRTRCVLSSVLWPFYLLCGDLLQVCLSRWEVLCYHMLQPLISRIRNWKTDCCLFLVSERDIFPVCLWTESQTAAFNCCFSIKIIITKKSTIDGWPAPNPLWPSQNISLHHSVNTTNTVKTRVLGLLYRTAYSAAPVHDAEIAKLQRNFL